MANELVYIGSVKEGKLHIVNRKGFDKDVEGFEGQRLIIRIKKYRKSRSNKQNAFYHANFLQSQIDCFKERWGYSYDKTQVHNWNKQNFWGDDHIDEDTGEVFKLPASSTECSTVEWENKMDIMRTFFKEKFDWDLPFHEKQSKMNY